MPLPPIEPHDWYHFDYLRGLEARQRSAPLQGNEWEVRDAFGRTAVLRDDDFDRLRADPDWLPEELR